MPWLQLCLFYCDQGFELGIWVGLVGDVVGPGLPRPARLDVDGVRGPGDPGSNLRPLDQPAEQPPSRQAV